MKKLLYLSLIAILLACCTQTGERIVERPEAELRNNTVIEIDKVIANDTVTILYIDAFFSPNQWIRIASDTYIRAGAEKLIVTDTEGIELDTEHYMSETGESSFVLYFPPLPKGTKSFDFIESDCDDCFKIWGIDLTENYKPDYKLPKEFRTASDPDSSPLPQPELKVAKTKVKVQAYGAPEGYNAEAVLMVGNFLKGEYETITASEQADGVYTFEFDAYGTSPAVLRVGNSRVNFIIAPGDNAEVHYDVVAHSTGSSKYSTLTQPVYAGFKGTYAAVNNEMNTPGKQFEVNLHQLIFDPTTWEVEDAQYPDKVAELKEAATKEIDELDISENLRRIYHQDINSHTMYNILNKDLIQGASQYFATGQMPEEKGPQPFTDPTLSQLVKTLEPNNTYWLLSRNFPSIATVLSNKDIPETALLDLTGSDTGLWQDIRLSVAAIKNAESDEGASTEELENLDKASLPFYREIYETMHRNALAAKQKALEAGGFVIVDVPDVPADQILETIIAGHKGKAVFVDFWATWCGPCLNAMKQIKPLKAEMEEHGVVMIYISNVSSPENKWMTMLPDIGGIHYYLGESEWRTLSGKYDIQGIPQYMIFDKEGNKTFQTAGFPGVAAMRAELEKVW